MSFRDWLRELWLEHVDEIITWTGHMPAYTSRDYFKRYKWWLRREYQFQKGKVK